MNCANPIVGEAPAPHQAVCESAYGGSEETEMFYM